MNGDYQLYLSFVECQILSDFSREFECGWNTLNTSKNDDWKICAKISLDQEERILEILYLDVDNNSREHLFAKEKWWRDTVFSRMARTHLSTNCLEKKISRGCHLCDINIGKS